MGLSSLCIVAGNALLGTLLAWLVLARRTRLMTERLGAMTMPELLAVRLGARWLKVTAALVMFVFFAPYSAVLLTSLGAWGLPQMVHKFYVIRDEKVVRPAIVISTVFAAFMTFGASYAGALSRLFPGVNELAVEKRFDEIVPVLLTKALPETLAAVILLLVSCSPPRCRPWQGSS